MTRILAMKSKLGVPLIVAIVVGASVAAVVANYGTFFPRQWNTYTSPDGTFSIELPAKPTIDTTPIPMGDGGTTKAITINAAPSSGAVYQFGYFNDDRLSSKAPDDILAAANRGSLERIGATSTKETRIEVQGYPAMETQAQAPGNASVDTRMVLVGNRLYMIVAVAKEKERDAETIYRVMDSFKILSK